MMAAGADAARYKTVLLGFFFLVVDINDDGPNADDQEEEKQKDIDGVLLGSEAG